MANIDEGPVAWRSLANHNRMIALAQDRTPASKQEIELAYFGSSAFRITSPKGVTIMIDPWRNHPSRHWDWYIRDFPLTAVDIGVSTHAHFDHDALNRLDAHVLIDRLIGGYSFLDVSITGIPDKHATESGFGNYDFKKIHKELHGTEIEPPNNPRSWDNCLIVVDTGGMRILHWGDNRHDPPDHVWASLGRIDIALLPMDGSQHVISFEMVASIVARLRPKIVVPHHYYIWDLTQRQSTLLGADGWVNQQKHVRQLLKPSQRYAADDLPIEGTRVDFFGELVAFDKLAWRNSPV